MTSQYLALHKFTLYNVILYCITRRNITTRHLTFEGITSYHMTLQLLSRITYFHIAQCHLMHIVWYHHITLHCMASPYITSHDITSNLQGAALPSVWWNKLRVWFMVPDVPIAYSVIPDVIIRGSLRNINCGLKQQLKISCRPLIISLICYDTRHNMTWHDVIVSTET